MSELKIGKTYIVRHQRKGTFHAEVLSFDDEWARLLIVKGRAEAMMDYNVVDEGETITVRRSMCTFEPV